jgi:pectate lyase
MKKNQYILILVALLIAGLSFFAGTRYQLNRLNNSRMVGEKSMIGNQRGQQFAVSSDTKSSQNNLSGGTMISGELLSQDEQSLTVKIADGSTKIVIVADSTIYKKSSDAALTDLTIGENLSILGTNNTDGSVTAKTITIGNMMLPIGQGRPQDAD